MGQRPVVVRGVRGAIVPVGVQRGIVTPAGGRSPLITLTQLFRGMFFTKAAVVSVDESTATVVVGVVSSPPLQATRTVTRTAPQVIPASRRVMRECGD